MKDLAYKLEDVFKNHAHIAIVSHINPDADALGSMLSLYRILKGIGKEVVCASKDAISSGYIFGEDISAIRKSIEFNKYRTVVALDSGEIKRTGFIEELQKFKPFIINIDHHPQEDFFGDINIVDPKASSTAEILAELYKTLGFKVDKTSANYLLAGIIYDTKSFQHSNTSPRSFKLAADLMKLGARPPKLAKKIYRVKPVKALKLWGAILSRVKVDSSTKMAYSMVTRDDFEKFSMSHEDLAEIVSLINTVSDAKFSLLLSERGDNVIKGSLRSEDFKKVDVSKIAAAFGGGGHALSSGFTVEGSLRKKGNNWVIKS